MFNKNTKGFKAEANQWWQKINIEHQEALQKKHKTSDVVELYYLEKIYNKYYDKQFQAKANQWWQSLSINEMKSFEAKHKTTSPAIASDIARIYDYEVLSTNF